METLARKSHDLEKLRSPTNAASDWCGAGSVDYLNSNQCINQQNPLQKVDKTAGFLAPTFDG